MSQDSIDMYDRLQRLRERCRVLAKNGRSALEQIKADPALAKEIEEVYLYFFGRAVKGCSNCLWDALLELTYTFKANTMKTDKFILKRGKILHDTVKQDASLDATRNNMTEELALYHLYTNPHARAFFEVLPANVDSMVAAYGKKYDASQRKVGNTPGAKPRPGRKAKGRKPASEITGTAAGTDKTDREFSNGSEQTED